MLSENKNEESAAGLLVLCFFLDFIVFGSGSGSSHMEKKKKDPVKWISCMRCEKGRVNGKDRKTIIQILQGNSKVPVSSIT